MPSPGGWDISMALNQIPTTANHKLELSGLKGNVRQRHVVQHFNCKFAIEEPQLHAAKIESVNKAVPRPFERSRGE